MASFRAAGLVTRPTALVAGARSGVQAGDQIILNGGYGLGEKSKVKVKGQAKS